MTLPEIQAIRFKRAIDLEAEAEKAFTDIKNQLDALLRIHVDTPQELLGKHDAVAQAALARVESAATNEAKLMMLQETQRLLFTFAVFLFRTAAAKSA